MGNKLNFELSRIRDNMDMVDKYVASLTGVVDEFWEEHILNGDYYLVMNGEVAVGFFTIYEEWDKKKYITSYYLDDAYMKSSKEILVRIISEYHIEKAYVATCDESFLSVCLDLNKGLELQAYFFDGTIKRDVREAEYGMEYMKIVTVEEMPEIRLLTGDFYDNVTDDDILSKKCELYRILQNEETLGVGIMVPGKLQKGYTSCGEFVLEQHRRKGVARSLQLNMADICREREDIPIGGCWYKNINSYKTFYSCGRYSKTRLLNISF